MTMTNRELKRTILEAIGKHHSIDDTVISRVDTLLESISDQNQFIELQEVMDWLKKRQEELEFSTEKIPLRDVKGWGPDEVTGNIEHERKEFFSVIGVRTSTMIRERPGGWDQPMVDQGTKSSLVGQLRKPFNGVPHYLIEAKAEPGNFGKLQLSPTLQVTFSNLQKAHEGRKPNYADYFEEPNGDDGEYADHYDEGSNRLGTTLYRQWLPEDGGRFYQKRILFKLVELRGGEEVPLVIENFIWLTLFQIKELLKLDNIINPHLRSIIAHL
jgi:dTDP-4-dehydro-6-deoxy-alpha-D-glucopyranose 2,3-dehydratase